MPRTPEVFLEDILQAAERIDRYTAEMSIAEFRADTRTIDAVVRNLEIVGEATKKLPESIRGLDPDVEWKRIAGLRDILAHEYFGIDVDIVWDIIRNHLPDYARRIRDIKGKMP